MRLTATLLFALIVSSSATSSAQDTATPANCTYQNCALGLAPVWNGLDVTRGDSQRTVATLGFFLPQDISGVFAEDTEARDAAGDAFRIRRIAAGLTDAGIILGATGIARALFHGDWDGWSTGLTLAGVGALGAGVPFQFAADGALSRAVWLFNRRFAR